MKYSRFPFGLSLIAALLTACGSMPPPASEASAAAHVTAATQAAGTDLGALAKLCEQPPAVKPSPKESAKYLSTLMALPPPPPGQAFDNLFYVGATWVSAWALRTSDGIILIDALDNATEAETDIEAGLRQLGMDPAQIKYIIVTHGHGDHYGGVNHLVDK